MPGMAELEVKEQRPAETNPIEHLGEYIHPPRLEPRTIGHKTRRIGPYRPRGPRNTSCHGGPNGTCGNHFANGRWKNRDLAGNACPFPRTTFVRHANRNKQCELFSSQPPPSSWPERR